jgi:hypothetical protein
MDKSFNTKRILGISMNKIVSIIFLLLSLLISLALTNVSILVNSNTVSLPDVLDSSVDIIPDYN